MKPAANKRKYTRCESDSGISVGSSHESDDDDYTYESYYDSDESGSTEIIDLVSPQTTIDLVTPQGTMAPLECPSAPLRRKGASTNLLKRQRCCEVATDSEDDDWDLRTQEDPVAQALLEEEAAKQRLLEDDQAWPESPTVSQRATTLRLAEEEVARQRTMNLDSTTLHVEDHPEVNPAEVCPACYRMMLSTPVYPMKITETETPYWKKVYRVTYEVWMPPCRHSNRKPWFL